MTSLFKKYRRGKTGYLLVSGENEPLVDHEQIKPRKSSPKKTPPSYQTQVDPHCPDLFESDVSVDLFTVMGALDWKMSCKVDPKNHSKTRFYLTETSSGEEYTLQEVKTTYESQLFHGYSKLQDGSNKQRYFCRLLVNYNLNSTEKAAGVLAKIQISKSVVPSNKFKLEHMSNYGEFLVWNSKFRSL